VAGIEHRIVACPEPFEDLGECSVCGSAEGQLLRWCPGYRLNGETQDACYDGNVIDMGRWAERRDRERKREVRSHE
jgi:hypothetical protein